MRQRNDAKGCKGPVLFPVLVKEVKRYLSWNSRGSTESNYEQLCTVGLSEYRVIHKSDYAPSTIRRVAIEFAKVALVCFSRRI